VGKVLQAFYGEDGKLNLYLNKGSSSKLHVGMTGSILEGTDGGKVFDNATFTIVKVINEGQSVATSDYSKALGKNNRFMVTKQR
jgi:hypothetical protein